MTTHLVISYSWFVLSFVKDSDSFSLQKVVHRRFIWKLVSICSVDANYIWAQLSYLQENRAHTNKPTFHLTQHPPTFGSNLVATNDSGALYILLCGSRY
jgi:hypothetical protein